MYTTDDLIDAILEALKARKPAAPGAPAPKRPASRFADSGPRARPFLSEHAIRKALAPGARRLTIPKDAIVSPLALDWLALQGIELIRE